MPGFLVQPIFDRSLDLKYRIVKAPTTLLVQNFKSARLAMLENYKFTGLGALIIIDLKDFS